LDKHFNSNEATLSVLNFHLEGPSSGVFWSGLVGILWVMRAVKIKPKTQTEAETDLDSDMRGVGVGNHFGSHVQLLSIQQSNHHQTNHQAETSTPPYYQYVEWARRSAQSQWLTCGFAWYASHLEPAFKWQTRNHGVNFNMTFGGTNWIGFKTDLKNW